MLQASSVFAGVQITNNPVDVIVTDGTTLTLQVTANSTSVPANPLLYQWFKQNGLSYDSVTSPSTSNKLVIANATNASAGVYRVEVSETITAATQTSGTATVTVRTRPRITVQPAAPAVMKRDGDNVSFTVTVDASGTPDFTYTWQKKVGSTYVTLGVPVTKPDTTDTFNLNNLTLADAGTYRVRISNPSSIVAVSKEVVLKLNSRPVILTPHVTGMIITYGASGTLKVVAGGNPKLQYRWYKNNVAIPNSDKATLAIKGTDSTADGVAEGPGSYKVKIINGYSDFGGDPPNFDTVGTNTESAAPAIVRVIRKPAIVTQPLKLQEKNIVGGAQNAGLSVVMNTSGDPGTFTYQWFKDNKPYAGPGALTSAITFTPVAWQDRGSYKVVVRNEVGSVTSTSGVLSIISPPLIISQTTGPVFAATKGSVKLLVTAGGTSPLKYEWFFKPLGAPDFGANIVGKTATLSLSGVTTNNIGDYKCVITNTSKVSTGSIESVPVFVQVDDAPKITTQTKVDGVDTVSVNLNPGNKLHLLVAASGTNRLAATPDAPANPMTYQWQKDNVDVAGQTSADLVINAAVVGDTGKYRCIVKNLSGTVTSNALAIVVSGPPVASIQPSATVTGIEEAAAGTTVGFTATHPQPVKYKWQRRSGAAPAFSWADVAGKTTQKLSFTQLKITDDGVYRCVAYNSFGQVASNDVQVSVTPIPPAVLGPQPGLSTVEFYPRVAKAGEKVRLFGSNFNYVSEVSFSDKKASFVKESDNSLLLTVPTDAPTTASAIKVTTKGKLITSVGGSTVQTTNLFTRVTVNLNDRTNATILSGVSGPTQILSGDNSDVSLIADIYGSLYYYIKVPKRSMVIVGCDGQYSTTAGTYMDPSLEVARQAPGNPGSITGPDGVVIFPLNFQHQSIIVGNISEQVSFNTDYDNQYIFIKVRSSAPPGFGLTGFGPFTLYINITAMSSSSSSISNAAVPPKEKLVTNTEATWQASASEAMTTTADSGSGIKVSFGGTQSKASEPVLLWRDDSTDQLGNAGNITAGFTMQMESAPAGGGDDQFSWQLNDASGKSLGALWVDSAQGALRLVEPNGTVHASVQRMTPGGGGHYFVINVDSRSSTWTVSMDGVSVTEPVPLPAGTKYGEIYGVWDLGPDAVPSGAAMTFSNFQVTEK